MNEDNTKLFSGTVLRKFHKGAEYFVEVDILGYTSYEFRYEPAAWTPISGEHVDLVCIHQKGTWFRLLENTKPKQIAGTLLCYSSTEENAARFSRRINGYPEKNAIFEYSMRKAYRDVCRTIRGLSNNPNKDQIITESKAIIQKQIELLNNLNIQTKEEYADWHKKACEELIQVFQSYGYTHLTFGHAQKWINMTIKYLFCSGEPVSRFGARFRLFHIPLDNYVFDFVKNWPGFEKVKFQVPWSKQTDYDAYLRFQLWFAQQCGGTPIAAELWIWNEMDEKARQQK